MFTKIIKVPKKATIYSKLIMLTIGGIQMKFLRWFLGIVVVFFLVSIIFSLGSSFINYLLIISSIVFIIDSLFIINKST